MAPVSPTDLDDAEFAKAEAFLEGLRPTATSPLNGTNTE